MPVRDDVLGRGPTFPFKFEKTGRVSMSSGIDLVRQSISMILDVRVGSRIVLRTFGSRLRDLIFEPIDSNIDVLAEHGVREALVRHERRASAGPVIVDKQRKDEGVVDLGIRFVVNRTQQPGNIVFPFHLTPSEQDRVGIGPGQVT